MRCLLPISDNSPKFRNLRELVHSTSAGEDMPCFHKDQSIRSPETKLHRLHDLLSYGTGQRLALVSRMSTLRDVKEMGRDLHHAQDNFATIFQASPAILCIIQLNHLRYREINKVYEQRTGYSRSEVLGKAGIKLGLWKTVRDRERIFQKLLAKGSLQGHHEDFQTKTGELLKTILSAEIIEYGGEPCALIVAEDITMRRQAEAARQELAQRLINAQEAERAHVARELHDNIGQSLALLSMELEKTRLMLTGSSPDSNARLAHLCSKLKDLGRVVGNLSHQLHSSELELLGLAAAIKGLCQEFSEQYHMKVNCTCCSVSENLCADISLCLFRVMQEALNNVAKHSQARKIDIKVRGTLHSLHLSISDDGVGFAPNNAIARPGLGLTSMRERLHLIGGKFTITSKPGVGTRIEAVVPISKTSFTITRTVSTPLSHP
jgi:PAS domain S-box-containing protein